MLQVVQDLNQYSSLRKLGSAYGVRGHHSTAVEGFINYLLILK